MARKALDKAYCTCDVGVLHIIDKAYYNLWRIAHMMSAVYIRDLSVLYVRSRQEMSRKELDKAANCTYDLCELHV